jgi:hypothetical protein
VTRLHILCAALSVGSISAAAPAMRHPSLNLSWERIVGFPNTLVLRLQNPGSSALCVPDVDSKEKISFTQGGQTVERFYYHNRPVLEWRGADLISGLIVVPPRRRVDIYYDLNEWMLKRRAATVSVNIPVYNCRELFRETAPHSESAISHFNFDAVLSVAPKE